MRIERLVGALEIRPSLLRGLIEYQEFTLWGHSHSVLQDLTGCIKCRPGFGVLVS
jgi:hypothetical protein